MNALINIIKINIENRQRVWSLAKTHQKILYRGSDMGLLWAICKPLMYIVVFYVALAIGFRSTKAVDGTVCPYFIWLSVGMISFFYMRDIVVQGANCFKRYAVFVTGVKYPIETLPATVTISYFLIHLVMVGIVMVGSILMGNYPSIYWLQLPFYMLLALIICFFWSLATGFISVVYRDFFNLLQVINQALFWLSGALFDVNGMSPVAQKVFYFNPITYILEGYRNAICRHIWFWQEPVKFACFITTLLIIMVVSIVLYKKLRKRIPDILQ